VQKFARLPADIWRAAKLTTPSGFVAHTREILPHTCPKFYLSSGNQQIEHDASLTVLLFFALLSRGGLPVSDEIQADRLHGLSEKVH